MSTPSDCYSPCPIITPVQVPGPTGANGGNAFTVTTTPISLNMVVGTLVTLDVVSSQWMTDNQIIFISDGTSIAHFLVVAQPVYPYTQVTCIYEPQTNDTVGGLGVSIASGASVAPSAYDGLSAYTLTTSQVTIPANTSTPVTINVLKNTAFSVGAVIVVGDNTNLAHFVITGKTGSSQLTATWLDSQADSASGLTIGGLSGGAVVAPSARDGLSASKQGAVTMLYSDTLGYIVTGVVTGQNIGPTSGYDIPAGTLASSGYSIEFEAWFKVLVIGGNKTVYVYWAGTLIYTYGAAAPAANTFLKVSGRIVVSAASPTTQLCLITSVTPANAIAASEVSVTADPTIDNYISFTTTQSNAADSIELYYFMAKLLP